MAFWEFLIQKEGDRSWLPLESPTVEILEGWYRVVARSSRVHAPVEIRVIQNAVAETPPVRRTQKRLSQTNQDGLMVVIPFTRLVPGEWELRCGSDVMSDMMGEGWLYRVQLQVLPIDLEANDDWEPDWQEEVAIAASESVPVAEASQVVQEAEFAQETEFLQAQPKSQPKSQPEASFISEPDAEKSSDTLTDRSSAVQLRLDQEAYVVKRGLPLILSGHVLSGHVLSTQALSEQALSEQALGEESRSFEKAVISGGKLRVRLFDPQTSRMLVDETQPLFQVSGSQVSSSEVSGSQPPYLERSLPLQFSIPLILPPDRETHLILGELALYGTAEGQLPPVLATQSFSVTTDLLELLEAIANDFSEPEPELAIKPAVSSVSTAPPSIQFRPSQPSLPPLLRVPDPEKEPRSLQLPTLVDPVTELEDALDRQPTEISSESESDRSSASEVAPELAPELAESEVNNLSSPSSELQPQLQLIDEAEDPAIDWQRVDPQVPLWKKQASHPDLLPNLPQTPEDNAFRALNLQERFLERLQALAADPELADWLSAMANPEAIDGSDSAGEAGVFVRRSPDQAIGLDADLAAQEIVVDEPFFTGRSQPGQHSAHQSVISAPISSTTALTEVLTEPIATPQLTVPTGEWVAGQTIDITVKIPDTYARMSVKLWTHDRQSRTLLDGPHWLTEFSPDGFGNLVSKTQIMVPFGCLEVQLEAIAIDMSTQYESDKVSVMRSVIPPDLTAISAVF